MQPGRKLVIVLDCQYSAWRAKRIEDLLVRDLVNFMTWMAEPNQLERKQAGYVVLLVLLVLLVLAYLLYKEFWKDVH